MIKITRVRDYYRAIRSINRKHVTLEMLSKKSVSLVMLLTMT